MRTISHSEAVAVHDCQSKHAFKYTGVLTGGTTLKPKAAAPRLREGRAWGRAVADWHTQTSLGNPLARIAAHTTLREALDEDANQQREHGIYHPDAHEAMATKLRDILDHYMDTAEPIGLYGTEHELETTIPSRTGRRASNHYRFQAYCDGLTQIDGQLWIVEFKLRSPGNLRTLEQAAREPQMLRYAWAYERATGTRIAGVIVDERLNDAPKPVKIKKDGDPYAASAQSCRLDEYLAAWEATGNEPDPEQVAKIAAKDWQRRHKIVFRDTELNAVGPQIVSTARLIHDLESGRLYPVRNTSPQRCGNCEYREICDEPSDVELVDELFERTVPKRNRSSTQREEIAA